jgi:cytochrome c oxidase subunit IV
LVFVGIMVFESNYTLFTRILFFGLGPSVAGHP